MSTNTDQNDNILELRDVSVRFSMERGESRVLDSVDLDVRRKETIGVVGESGSGKSMCASAMLNAIVNPGILTGEVTYYPDDGPPVDVLSLDQDELRRLRWEEIAFLIQSAQSAFNPTMTIRGHFLETLEAHNVNTKDGLEHAKELLSELYLTPEQVLNAYPHELSGGMKQRALIALSLVLDPNVLVMDEPTSALDLLMQRSIISLLEKVSEEYDLTLVFVTHDMPIVSDIADRLAVMYAFEIVEIGPTETVLNESAHPYTRALINSVPDVVSPVEKMKPIPGASPDPINVPEGCSYHPRCPLSDDQCRSSDPGFHDVSDSHQVTCFHWEEVDEKIKISIDTPDEETPEEQI